MKKNLLLLIQHLYYNSTKELHIWGFPVLLPRGVFNRTDPAENTLQSQQEHSACHLHSTLLPAPEETTLLPVTFSRHTGQIFLFAALTSEAPCRRLFLCLQYCISVPFLHTQRLNGSHSAAFGDATPQFGLSKDLKCAVPCPGESHWQVRFDGTSTKLSILFPLSVLGLDTKTTTLLGAETWYLPCSSELPKCATLC